MEGRREKKGLKYGRDGQGASEERGLKNMSLCFAFSCIQNLELRGVLCLWVGGRVVIVKFWWGRNHLMSEKAFLFWIPPVRP